MGLLAFMAPGWAQAPPAAQVAPAPRKGTHTKKPQAPRKPGGRHWPGQGEPLVEKARLCILRREAGNDYTAVDPSRHWFGGYQFNLRTSDTAARRMKRPELLGVPASQWDPADQDAAFYLIWDRGHGKKHWSGGRSACF